MKTISWRVIFQKTHTILSSMKRVFYINEKFENKVSFYHLLIFLFALPFDRIYTTLILISYLVCTLIFFKKSDLGRLNSTTLLFQSVFFVSLLSATYAPSFFNSLDVITRQLALLLFPLVLALNSENLGEFRSKLLNAFSISCTLAIIYLYYDALKVIRYNHLTFQ